MIKRLKEEVNQLVSKAEEADTKPLEDGLSIPDNSTVFFTLQAAYKFNNNNLSLFVKRKVLPAVCGLLKSDKLLELDIKI